MTNEDLKLKISSQVPDAEFSENKQFTEALIPHLSLHKLALWLKNDPETRFDYLFCLTGVDYGSELAVVYHLNSTSHKHDLVLKVKTNNRENPSFDTVCDIWRTAEYFEREVFDLFGIRFNNHPDMRRLFLDDDWKGFPLRKDYTDEHTIERK